MGQKHKGRLELTWTNKDRALLSSADGEYDYTWVDPSDYRVSEIRLLHEVDSVSAPDGRLDGTGLPEPMSDNLLITGDAMHALSSLSSIPEYSSRYLGNVKLVYIDPPFNTGQAFEHYDDNIEHSIWLTMLRDRLRQIKPLLSPDGSVWVHLDDTQVHRCRLVLDEVMGESNFVGEIVWQKSDTLRNDASGFSVDQDFLLVYRNSDAWRPQRMARTAQMDSIYSSPDGDLVPWFDGGPTAPGAATHQGMVYAVQQPITGELIYPIKGRCWAMGKTDMELMMSEYATYQWTNIRDEAKRAEICGKTVEEIRPDVPALMLAEPLEVSAEKALSRYMQGRWPKLFLRGKDGRGGLGKKTHLPSGGVSPRTWWTNAETGSNRTAKAEMKALFPHSAAFSTPKPERLLERVIHISTNPGDVVLDCFAGSGTTAAVAHKMGRRWVTSELLPSTVDTYTKPRLTKVVLGEDPGGITTTTRNVAAGSLPEGMLADDAKDFNRLLLKVAKSLGDDMDDDAEKNFKDVMKQLRGATKVRNEKTINWFSGGGFTHLEVGPSMFEEFDGMVMIAEWAVSQNLARAVCAQIKVDYQPDGIFAGRRGRTPVMVIDAMVGTSTIEAVIGRLGEGEVIEIWATQASSEAEELLRSRRPGSKLNKIPHAVLDSYRQKPARNVRMSERDA